MWLKVLEEVSRLSEGLGGFQGPRRENILKTPTGAGRIKRVMTLQVWVLEILGGLKAKH